VFLGFQDGSLDLVFGWQSHRMMLRGFFLQPAMQRRISLASRTDRQMALKSYALPAAQGAVNGSLQEFKCFAVG
jgi:hypothetical protein